MPAFVTLKQIEIDKKGVCQIEQNSYAAIGFGTYPLKDEICTTAISEAIKNGYSIIDTATFYNNFRAIAPVLKEKGRQQVYLISKVWPDKHRLEDLRKDLQASLEELQTSYLDAYLLHWPNSSIPIEDSLKAMEEFKNQKLIRHIGLSNVTVHHLRRALEVGVPITWVQVEMNPFFYDAELLAFCQEKGIGVQAWAPLGKGRVNKDKLLKRIGKKYRKSPSQVALRWIVQHGCIPLPASQDKKHIQENMEIGDFALSAAEMEEIDARAKVGERRRVNNKAIGLVDEFDFSYEECWPKERAKRMEEETSIRL